ncbi:helix-turn-helix domain-containing protein [Streptomyces sp. T1317-0309]|nr:helix-turn-helix domain-containing protein [Streptomyces sp. T1317-0309]
MAARPIDDDDREQVRKLHAAGQTRNQIATAIKRSPSTVTKIAKELGLTFDRAAEVATATTVRLADLAARRAAMAEKLQGLAERELVRAESPTMYWAWGGKDHEYDERQQPMPTAPDRRAIVSAIGTALDKSLKLVPPKEDGAQESKSVIGDLMAGLLAEYIDRKGTPPPAFEEPEDDDDEDTA